MIGEALDVQEKAKTNGSSKALILFFLSTAELQLENFFFYIHTYKNTKNSIMEATPKNWQSYFMFNGKSKSMVIMYSYRDQNKRSTSSQRTDLKDAILTCDQGH